MHMKGRFNNPMMHCCFGHPHQLHQLSLGMPLPQWYTLDALLNELWQILRHSPGNFFWDNSSGELITPVACMCSACFHSLCIVEYATLNLSVTAMMEPLLRQSSVAVISNMLIICQIHFGWVTMGCLLIRGILRFHHLLKPVLQTLTLFSPLFMVVTFKQMTIKHSIYVYAKSTLSIYRKGLYGFFLGVSPY